MVAAADGGGPGRGNGEWGTSTRAEHHGSAGAGFSGAPAGR